jgi:VCBS repeat-containing protein
MNSVKKDYLSRKTIKLSFTMPPYQMNRAAYLQQLMATIGHSAFALMETGNFSYEGTEVQQLVQLFNAADASLQKMAIRAGDRA